MRGRGRREEQAGPQLTQGSAGSTLSEMSSRKWTHNVHLHTQGCTSVPGNSLSDLKQLCLRTQYEKRTAFKKSKTRHTQRSVPPLWGTGETSCWCGQTGFIYFIKVFIQIPFLSYILTAQLTLLTCLSASPFLPPHELLQGQEQQ